MHTRPKTKSISFQNHMGLEISARLDLPIDQHPDAYAIFAHCFGCHKNDHAVRNISNAMTLEGIGVLSFDFTSQGQSAEDGSETHFSGHVRDLLDAAHFLEEYDTAPSILIGHSTGGVAALYGAKMMDSVRAVVTIGTPASTGQIQQRLHEEIERTPDAAAVGTTNDGRPFDIDQHDLDALLSKELETIVPDLGKALLIMHAPGDRIVHIGQAGKLYQLARHPKSFITLDQADHALSKKEDGLYAGKIIAHWAAHYLEKPAQPESLTTDAQVLVRLNAEDKYTTQVKADRHVLTADEPASVGGHDFGPSPYQLLLSGLGTCTAMTLMMYARRKNWPLEEVDVHLNYSRQHAKDSARCGDPRCYLHRFDAELVLKGSLTVKQRGRLLEIARKCPVHRTLTQPIEISLKKGWD